MKVKKFEDEFEKYNPNRTPLGDDEEDAEPNPLQEEIPLGDAVYGKKLEQLQMNPITLADSSASMGDIFAEKTAGKGE